MTKNITYEVVQDELLDSPRDWDNLGTMICSHRRYTLGDRQFNPDDFEGWNGLKEYLRKEEKALVILPLYLYDHSGISMFTDGDGKYRQHQAWDSGQVGFIYATEEDIDREYGDHTVDSIEKAIKLLKNEIETYSMYLEGDVYYVTAYGEDGEEIDSCGGIYGQDGVEDFKVSTESWYVPPRDSVKAKTAQELHS